MPEVRLIDANAFAEKYGNYYAEEGPAEGFIGTVGDLIDKQPTIEAEPVRHGRWIESQTELICSVCKWKYSDELPFMSNHGLDSMEEAFVHCPHCGARMDGGE